MNVPCVKGLAGTGPSDPLWSTRRLVQMFDLECLISRPCGKSTRESSRHSKEDGTVRIPGGIYPPRLDVLAAGYLSNQHERSTQNSLHQGGPARARESPPDGKRPSNAPIGRLTCLRTFRSNEQLASAGRDLKLIYRLNPTGRSVAASFFIQVPPSVRSDAMAY